MGTGSNKPFGGLKSATDAEEQANADSKAAVSAKKVQVKKDTSPILAGLYLAGQLAVSLYEGMKAKTWVKTTKALMWQEQEHKH